MLEMKKLLYIGNKLSHSGKTETTIDSLGNALEGQGFNIIYASSYRNILARFLHMLYSVFKYRNKVDYVLIDTYSTLNFYYAYAVSQLCRVFKLKYIPILHGGNLPQRIQKSPKLSQAIFNNAYVNVAPSNYTKSNFEDLGYTNLVCIPNFIKLENYLFQEKSFKTARLLWVRSFSTLYNPNLAIKVLKKLKDKGVGASLCMIGPDNDGSLQKARDYANSLQVNVEFTGKLSKQEWTTKASDYNIFINTTNFDNMPVSVIEAMALGLPVISTNVGGIPYLIENNVNGILVKSNNVVGFVDAVLSLLENPLKGKKISEKARKQVEDYKWNRVKLQWKAILK